jgi:ABC-type bacteriocin/lantibiotic exporter with double-glycine peptidase domain
MLVDLRMTRVFAAHRPDTIRIADRVITLSRTGKISEEPSSLRAARAAGSQVYEGERYV